MLWAKLLIGAMGAILAAVFGGKLMGDRKYKKGYTEGRMDQVDELERSSEAAQEAIAMVDGIAEEEALRTRERAIQEAESLVGRKPTDVELMEFLKGPH